MKMFKFIIIYGLITLFSNTLYAVDFSLSPSILKIKAFPGEIKEVSLKITNHEKEERTFRLYTTDITAQEGEIDITSKEEAGLSKWSCAKWIEIETTEVRILPEEEKEIKIKLMVPIGNAGGRYAGIVCEDVLKEEELQEGASIKLRMEVVCLVELTIEGAITKQDLSIRHIRTNPTLDGWEINVFVQNKGNIHTQAKGICLITDEKNRIVERKDIISSTVILPDETFNYPILLKKTLSKGTYTVLVRLYYGKGKMVEGKSEFISEGILSHLKQKKEWDKKEIPFCIINPPVLELSLEPGRFSSHIIGVKNIRDEEVQVKAEIKDFEINEADGEIIWLTEIKSPFAASSWLKIQPSEFTISTGKEGKIRLDFNVPQNIKGMYWTGVLFDISTKEGFSSSSHLFILTKIGKQLKEDLEISKFEAKEEPDKIINFSILFKNRGEVYLQPSCYFILRKNNKLVKEMRLVEVGDIMLLPNSQRNFSFVLSDEDIPLPTGEYEAIIIVKAGNLQPIRESLYFNIGKD